jgi:DNA-binding MarR family transcriptional regulator
MSNTSTYIRFINLTHALISEWEGTDIDLLSLRLLEAIAIAHSEGNALTVTDAMALNAIASPATMHRKLTSLLDAKLIEQVFEGKNRRTKYLVPTVQASNYFEQLGKALVLASTPYSQVKGVK